MNDDRAPRDPAHDYHCWYYDNNVWQQVTFLGVPCLKSVVDMWNYQEILTSLQPSLVVEFGTNCGGSALYFAHILSGIDRAARVLTVDIEPATIVGCHPTSMTEASSYGTYVLL
jgi:cephalosporin hydroxylase